MDITKITQIVAITIIIVLMPIISIGQTEKIGDYKYSINAGVQYGVFFKPWYFADTTLIDYFLSDGSVDSLNISGAISGHIGGNFRIFRRKNFSMSIGLSLYDYTYRQKFYFNENLIDTNSFSFRAVPPSTRHIIVLSVPITLNLKIKRFLLSTGSMFYASWLYPYKLEDDNWFFSFNSRGDARFGYPILFLSTSYYLYKLNNSYILPEIGFQYRPIIKFESVYVYLSVNYYF
ncbi:MAG: hypothetical protein HOA61_08865 [Bacteroidetes bacterium]|jgi:hypothetical protein|nr:hypothetical protein [Bacteroidota bacterium]MBT6836143.1 hypothetical protein [Bacteroidota bacterium]